MESQNILSQSRPDADAGDPDTVTVHIRTRYDSYILAWHDIYDGFSNWHLWFYLGWNDILSRYRRSVLGPLWMTLNMAIMTGLTGILYGSLFHMDLRSYLPFLCAGMMLWSTFSNIVMESCVAFIEARHMLTQMHMTLSSFVFRTLWRNTIVFLHMVVVFVVVAVIFQQSVDASLFLIIPGLLLWVLNGLWLGLLLGTLAARFRDLPQVMGSLLQVGFFLTPILWKPDMLGNRIYLADANPLYHFLELVRGPLLGTAPATLSWLFTIAITITGSAVAFWVFARGRPRVPFWM